MAFSLASFSVKALLRLTRVGNLLIVCVAQYCAACFLLNKKYFLDWHLFALALASVLIAAAGYIINDYYDIKIDLVNKPTRVVIGKKIPRRIALFLHTVLSAAGVLIGLLLGLKIGATVFFTSFTLWWYSNSLKRQPFVGNFVVALLVGLSIELVNILYNEDNYLVTVYSLFAFFMTLLREIIKDMEDLKGDSSFGCRTLPIVWGIRKTKVFIYVLIAACVVFAILLDEALIKIPMAYFIPFLFVPIGAFTLLLVRADTVKEFNNLSKLCKAILLLGILSMIFVNK
jgi:4-hydroxybenzoate polyprenyltransferase